jgi:hypothetical protein
MLGRLLRALSILLFAWFVFIAGAVAYAKLFGRTTSTPAPDADEIDLVATFGPLNYAGRSQAFRGGRITTWFGGGQVDLREAVLAPGGATIRIQALFGGGNLIVPDDWRVETHVRGLGGASDDRPEVDKVPGAPTLRVEGPAIFGGWGITSAPAGGDLVHD